jgi:high affinity Mn2+ porin
MATSRPARRTQAGRARALERLVRLASLSALLCCAAALAAEGPAAPPAPETGAPDEPGAASVMKLLGRRGLHDLKEESWNAYVQLTYISSWKPSFPAAYTNLNGSTNSLLPSSEQGFTATATLFFGFKLWAGGEVYFVPEVIAERPFSQLRGLAGAIQNFELQKTGVDSPQLYRSRGYLHQTFGLGGGTTQKESDQMQLAAAVDRRRLVFTLGNFSILDVFDKNTFTSDTRQQFFSLGFMTHAAWDFASDARGYSYGAAVELYWDDWALRLARISPPQNPNQLPVGLRLDRYYGDSIELEHQHQLFGRDGVARLLVYRNREVTGRFDDAIAAFRADPAKNAAACTGFNYGSQNADAPDLCWVRAPNTKVGIGLNLEQHLTDDLGLFFRAMVSDGQTEVYAYTSSDRSASFGALGHGSAFGRPADVFGVAAGASWISSIHAEYLALGGVDGFVGDGRIRPAAETNLEAFYSVNFLTALWLSGDYQRVWNPAFNADRGPVNVFGVRFHAQY